MNAISRRALLQALIMIVMGFAHGTLHAQALRTWVSGVGDDANPCSRTAPCKTFAGAISKTAAKGEINALDPGGFGAVTITKSITISGIGTTASILGAGTNGVVISAGASDVVALRNLEIQGAGTGLNGIRFLNGAKLIVDNVVINGFTLEGIDFNPNSNSTLLVKDSIITNNTQGGIYLHPGVTGAATATIDRVTLHGNGRGVKADDAVDSIIRNSTASSNVNNGFVNNAITRGSHMTIEDSSSVANGGSGIRSISANSSVSVSRSSSNFNGSYGLEAASGGALLTFSNNNLNDNAAGDLAPGTPTGTKILR